MLYWYQISWYASLSSHDSAISSPLNYLRCFGRCFSSRSSWSVKALRIRFLLFSSFFQTLDSTSNQIYKVQGSTGLCELCQFRDQINNFLLICLGKNWLQWIHLKCGFTGGIFSSTYNSNSSFFVYPLLQ